MPNVVECLRDVDEYRSGVLVAIEPGFDRLSESKDLIFRLVMPPEATLKFTENLLLIAKFQKSE
jgi:hypothetical protein